MTMRSRVLLLPIGLLCGLFVSAQGQALTFGVSPGQSTSGTASDGGSGDLAVTIGGHGTIPVDVPPGTSSAGIAAAMAAALQAQGFTAVQNGTEVTVTAGPGGSPLSQGGGIGSTDTGITGVKAKVEPGAPPGMKQNGANVPKANPAQATNQNGSLQIDAEVLKLINGVWTPLHVQVVVPVLPGDDGDAVNARARQTLEAAGFKVNDIELPANVAPITPSPSMGLDRMDDGSKVQGVEVDTTGGANDLFPKNQAGAGQVPGFGASDYDRAVSPDGTERDNFSWFDGSTEEGAGGVLGALVAPNTFGLWLFGIDTIDPLFQVPVIPLPIFGPDMYLPMDPLNILMFNALPDPLGHMQFPLQIPPAPEWLGLELQTTAVTLDPSAPDLFLSLERTQCLAVRVGP
jgi:hypothetical protein